MNNAPLSPDVESFHALSDFALHDPGADSSPYSPSSTAVRILSALLKAAASGREALPLTRLRLSDAELGELRAHPQLFVIEHGHLWLPRYAQFAAGVRAFFEARLTTAGSGIRTSEVDRELDRILPAEQIRCAEGKRVLFDNADQRNAVRALMNAQVGVLTGGPGTGKTTTAAALLALYKRLNPAVTPGEILITAPTGKAACRIGESIAKASQHLKTLSETERAFLCEVRAMTLHRALEWRPVPAEKGGPFQRNANRRLPAHLVIVDEASMVDLSLMHALVGAMPDSGRLFLLGDADQLESVEAGGVLAELVLRGQKRANESAVEGSGRTGDVAHPSASRGASRDTLRPLPGLVHPLHYSRRAMNAPWILGLASLLRPGTRHTVNEVRVCVDSHEGLSWHENNSAGLRDRVLHKRWRQWRDKAAPWVGLLSDPASAGLGLALRELQEFALLCATNAQVDRANTEGIAILSEKAHLPAGMLPHGCPILIQTNAHDLGLTNGDIGIALSPRRDAPACLAVFPHTSGAARLIPIPQLPAHAPAFALTIHKSQGSEWRHVVIELPQKANVELLSKNLLYTGVTRSSQSVEIIGGRAILEAVLSGETPPDSDV